jgi:hypothetical protein
MLKTKIKKLQTNLLMKTNGTKFWNKYIKGSLLLISNWYLYPEFRRNNLLLSLIQLNRLPLLFTTLFIIWTITFFSFGRNSNFNKVKQLQTELSKTNIELESSAKLIHYKQSVIENIRFQVGSREYYEYIIKKDCHLRNPDNLSKLPDEIFFTMIDEIEKNKIPYTIFFRLIDFESGFTYITNPSSGAYGYCQILPSTFVIGCKHLNLKENSPINNIKIGVWVLKYGFNRWKAKGLSDEESWFNSLVDYSGGSRDLAQKEMMYYKDNLFEAKDTVVKYIDVEGDFQ